MKYEQIVQLCQSIINSITNTAAASLLALKKFLSESTFKVKVENPTEKVQVTGKVEVTNHSPLVNAIKGVILAINGLKKPIESQKKVSVTNFPDIKFPKFPEFKFPKSFSIDNLPKEIKVSNFKELVPALKMMADNIKAMDVRPEVKVEAPVVNVEAPVVNVPKQDPPVVNVKAPDLSELTKILEFFNSLGAKKPLPVRLSDGEKFYKALERMADIYTGGGSSSGFQTSDGSDGRAMLNGRSELKVTTSDTWDANDVDRVSSTLTRFGEETADGVWRVREVTKTGTITSIRHATARNNPDVEGYEAAWADRENLIYGYAREAL